MRKAACCEGEGTTGWRHLGLEMHAYAHTIGFSADLDQRFLGLDLLVKLESREWADQS